MKITINEKEYPLQWGLGAIEIYCDSMDCDIEGLDKALLPGREQPKAITNLVLAALKNGSELAGDDCDITYRQLQAWLDDAPQDQFKAIMEDFKDSKYLGRTIGSYLLNETDTDAAKKKSRSVKS